MGPISTQTFGLYSGALTTDDVCSIRLLNGVAFVNKDINIWNGTDFTVTP